jgi:hypothetical protein
MSAVTLQKIAPTNVGAVIRRVCDQRAISAARFRNADVQRCPLPNSLNGVAVDWFRFWMQGYEGKPPAYDPDQYVRWRKLKAQQEWNTKMTAAGKDPRAEFIRRATPGEAVSRTGPAR